MYVERPQLDWPLDFFQEKFYAPAWEQKKKPPWGGLVHFKVWL